VQSANRLATGWTVRGSNPGGGEIFRTLPEQPWGTLSLLYNGYRASFSMVNRPTPSSAEVKERVDLYLPSLCGPSWSVLGWTLYWKLRLVKRFGLTQLARPFRYTCYSCSISIQYMWYLKTLQKVTPTCPIIFKYIHIHGVSIQLLMKQNFGYKPKFQ
jgi:hypothetical protein